MENQLTCGKGLAEHSYLPARMGELTASVAENLELHMKALDLNDENSKQEYDAYSMLVKDHRLMANQLQAIANRMAGYRDLPMGRHDQRVLSTPGVREVFEKFVRLERELVTLLQRRLEKDRKMLAEMSGARQAS